MEGFWRGMGLVIVALLVAVGWQWPDKNVRLTMCDVGQGDAALVTYGFTQVFVDGGPPNGKLLKCLGKSIPFWDRTIEVVFISHPQADHIGGLLELVKRFKVNYVFASNIGEENVEFEGLADLLAQKKVPVRVLSQGMVVRVGEKLRWRTLWPLNEGRDNVWEQERWRNLDRGADDTQMDVNDQSLVGILSIDTLDMLFTGDVGTGVEYELVTSGLLPQVEVVKMPHHGSNTSSSVEFISLTRPEWVLVGVGEGNRFGHPVPEVLDRWEAMGSRVARTDTEGSVRLVYSEGKLVREK